jgi:enolase-phosphatase E1
MITAILTDIEGTTSSITFVKDVLFPFAARALPHFLEQHWQDAGVREQIQTLPMHAQARPADANTLLQQWIREDRKATPLKTIQGMIWRKGYESGELRAPIYPDALACLRQWQQQGLTLHVYSSGSIAAQKLFFQYSEAGDITYLFDNYFDTTSGSKKDPTSYQFIQRAIGLNANEILFLSDIEQELDAARDARLFTCLLDRDHRSISSTHPCVDTFARIHLEQFV